MIPEQGQIAFVRSRRYLVEDVVPRPDTAEDTLVRLSCLDDDAQGELLEVLWEREVDSRVLGTSSWDIVAKRGFDEPRLFSAYLHTLRWNCVTSTDAKLFQAPYRAGIEVKPFQLEPLRKALQMPRVGLFIADDVGIGKTIEAGLIVREMIQRQKVRRIVISCPPSVVRQWQEEMDARFGVSFVIYDRDYVAACRRQRGYSTNPWTTHTRFILSHALLRDEDYAGPLRDWLSTESRREEGIAPASLFILDEAHNAAPASGARYAVDSHLTRTVRDLAPLFEHKLFLSATPHNGHSNSFAALLEMLDPQRFCRGVPVRERALLDAVMVRRLKSDIREVTTGEFPLRKVVPVEISGLAVDAPDLLLPRLLDQYRALRAERLKTAPRSEQNAAMLVLTLLQKRLLSSIEAFARTLRVHQRAWENTKSQTTPPREMLMVCDAVGADDPEAELPEETAQAENDAQVELATRRSATPPGQEEWKLLDQMSRIAEEARHLPDGKIARLTDWIRHNLCPLLGKPGATWLDRRVIIFTEYSDTKSYIVQQLTSAIAGSDNAAERIKTFHGGMGEEKREDIKRAFNADFSDPLRILVATDAAREGVNLQNHCADLFHFDVPWNPSRMEQRNGRIDRKLQKAGEVRCHYFVLTQRPEDRVLSVLVRKTATIQKELGALSPVIERTLGRMLEGGISHARAGDMATAIEGIDASEPARASRSVVDEELEHSRKRREDLQDQVRDLDRMLGNARSYLRLDPAHFRDAISASLEILGAAPLTRDSSNELIDPDSTPWTVPALDRRPGADPSWADTLDSLRVPRQKDQKPWDWRREARIRPIVFADPGTLDGKLVHLHLEHKLARRLLGRFLSQGFLHDELSRACVCLTEDPTPKILALGRLSLYGEHAARLHDEIVAVASEWVPPEDRGRRRLAALPEGRKDMVVDLLETSLATPRLRVVPDALKERLKAGVSRDVEELTPHLRRRSEILTDRALQKLRKRGEEEAEAMVGILAGQKTRIEAQIAAVEARIRGDAGPVQMLLAFAGLPDVESEKRQLESDRKYWPERLKAIEKEMVVEPARIRASYVVKAARVEPVGVVYLWPVAG